MTGETEKMWKPNILNVREDIPQILERSVGFDQFLKLPMIYSEFRFYSFYS